ncbi:hypothetical protein LZ554_006731 [Drepanopeziza brunnea f. sp. 'monogermtubi']|nr:hypothetical protein LZ554_006731 [Drepanopeziza brunnea f. sp. 'monogermtubi']
MDVDNRNERGEDILSNGNDLGELPQEILEVIRLESSPRFLDALAVAALKPELTLRLFTRYEDIFADTSARWIGRERGGGQDVGVIGAFARALPLAPHLSTFLEKYLESTTTPGNDGPSARIESLWVENNGLDALGLQCILLAALRLLNLNNQNAFSQTISSANIQGYLKHADRGVRYLAVRILCHLCYASESKLEAMVEEHVGKSEAVMGDFDGRQVDYGFLSLFEGKRLKDATEALRYKKSIITSNLEGLSNLVLDPLL